MTYEELLNNYRSSTVFIYGRSVMQIVDMTTYMDSDVLKTDFIFNTDRNRKGVITIDHEKNADEKLSALIQEKKQTLEKNILEAVTDLVEQFKKETGSAPKAINLHTSAITSEKSTLVNYKLDGCTMDLDIYLPAEDTAKP